MDPKVCVLMNLVHYVEYTRLNNLQEEETEFLYGTKGTNEQIRKLLGIIFDDPDFKRLSSGLLGTHSFRKGSATYASR